VTRVSLPDDVYRRLLALRTGLRHFERWSEQQARTAGLTARSTPTAALPYEGTAMPKAQPLARWPTTCCCATTARWSHRPCLMRTAWYAGLGNEKDHRVVRLQLTSTGARNVLKALSALHLEELTRLARQLPGVWEGLAPVQRAHALPGPPSRPDERGDDRFKVDIGRV